jgi:hypothetical protein
MIFLAGRCSFHGLVVVAYVTSQTEGLRLNGLMASYNNYSTCDGILREDTCAFSPPPNVDCSQLNANSKAHHAGMRGLPIWFALPDIGRFSETKSIKCEDKSFLFSLMVPGNKAHMYITVNFRISFSTHKVTMDSQSGRVDGIACATMKFWEVGQCHILKELKNF